MFSLPILYTFISSYFTMARITIIPWLLSFPKWVYVAGAVLVGALFYGHFTADRARKAKDLEFAQKVNTEVMRQQKINDAVIQSANKRATDAEQRANTLQQTLDTITLPFGSKNGTVCIPSSVTDQLRGIGSKGSHRTKPARSPFNPFGLY